WVYRFFYSKTVGLVLIIAMAVLVLIGTLLQPQLTSAERAEPEQYAAFLEYWRSKFAPLDSLVSPVDALGLFDVYRSVLFMGVAGLLALSILACTAHRLPLLWKNWRHPRRVVPARAYDGARYHAAVPVPEGNVTVMATVGEVLRKQRYRVLTDADHPKAVYADRFSWGGFGAPVSHLSFVVIIAAVVISMNTGIDTVKLIPVGGDPVKVDGTSLRVQALSYDDTITDGRFTDYVSRLVVTRHGKKVAEKDVRVNSPLGVNGVRFHQSGYAHGVLVAATGPDGVLFDGFAMLRDFEGLPMALIVVEEGVDVISEEDGTPLNTGDLVLIMAVTPTDDSMVFPPAEGLYLPGEAPDDYVLQPGQVMAQVLKGDSVVGEALLDPGDDLVIGNYTFTFVGEQTSPFIRIRQDPGAPWMWVGSILLVLGITVTFACRHRRMWATWDAETNHIRFASTDKSDSAWARRFRATVEAVAQKVESTAEHSPPPTKQGKTADKPAAAPVQDKVEPSAAAPAPDKAGKKAAAPRKTGKKAVPAAPDADVQDAPVVDDLEGTKEKTDE
ncbi:MAG: cytochrome c biogenesis protein ResB, partial [Micrococcales bacterium]|nr:cytochrome c biogenesis protein ResB [Micrococcales bacterium]